MGAVITPQRDEVIYLEWTRLMVDAIAAVALELDDEYLDRLAASSPIAQAVIALRLEAKG